MRTRSRVRLGKIAAELGTTIDTVRYALQTHPMPTSPAPNTDHPGARPRRAGAFRYAKRVLTEERFRDLYHRQGQSLREVAATGRGQPTDPCALAADYQIPLREPGRPTTTATTQTGSTTNTSTRPDHFPLSPRTAE